MPMTKKSTVWLSMLIIVPLIAGIYGIIHDQITYSISSEYFTNFKFIQFGISHDLRESERLASCLVGFLATWWVGIPIALVSGGIGIRKLDIREFKQLKIRSIIITFSVAVLFGILGYLFGLMKFSNMADWPVNIGGRSANSEMQIAMSTIKDLPSFWVVGTIHNFSYLGGVIGLIVSVIFQIRIVKFRKNTN